MGLGMIEIWARPGSRDEQIEWDAWRKRWVVSCREPPTDGRANEAILRIVAERLGVPRTAVRFVTAGRTRAKVIEVYGLDSAGIANLLRTHRAASAGVRT